MPLAAALSGTERVQFRSGFAVKLGPFRVALPGADGAPAVLAYGRVASHQGRHSQARHE